MTERPNWVGNTHSCRRWPAWPNGASNVKPSPVPNPSSEMEKLWTRTWDMAASGALADSDVQLVTLTNGSTCKAQAVRKPVHDHRGRPSAVSSRGRRPPDT